MAESLGKRRHASRANLKAKRQRQATGISAVYPATAGGALARKIAWRKRITRK